ncbi:hypothetical protein N5079_19075 [Planotetraspora sp. A-T 1434]|uniref:hypothetical protein n=1 Tax=Planotetraspora sp. A-T 1434 TaxID=2979219 RepID=UPI0021C22374|nr:hypothetical protein [Planotetraspora sp. A-T 1434]MCT9932308.1 hypothetical protein [Planotetraspora sp. A-T 1434]
MGRHRSDPLGIARLALVGLAVLLLLALVVVGAKALFTSLGTDGAPTPGASASAPAAPGATGNTGNTGNQGNTAQPSGARVPTVQFICQADICPVFVRVPGGDVLMDRDLSRGEQASYFEPELDVVLDDAGTVEVLENGKPRPAGQPGERQTFSVKRAPGQ